MDSFNLDVAYWEGHNGSSPQRFVRVKLEEEDPVIFPVKGRKEGEELIRDLYRKFQAATRIFKRNRELEMEENGSVNIGGSVTGTTIITGNNNGGSY